MRIAPNFDAAGITLLGTVPRLPFTNLTRRNDCARVYPASDNQPDRIVVVFRLRRSHRNVVAWQLGEAPMRRLGQSGALYATVVVSNGIATGGIAVLSTSIAADPSRLEATSAQLARAAAWADDWAWLGILVCWCVTGACSVVRRSLGRPKDHAVIGELLNRFRNGVFGDESGDYAHHRVTLFKHYRFRPLGFDFRDRGWPWSGWLIPVARSGHTAQKTNVRFLAPDNTDRARGIAGRAWAAGTAAATDLPDVQSSSSTHDVQKYAERTSVTERWVKKKSPGARSLMGFIVEAGGTPWGVLVVDSRNPDLDLTKANVQWRNYGSLLDHLVEGT